MALPDFHHSTAIRVRESLPSSMLLLSYLLTYHQYVAASHPVSSFLMPLTSVSTSPSQALLLTLLFPPSLSLLSLAPLPLSPPVSQPRSLSLSLSLTLCFSLTLFFYLLSPSALSRVMFHADC